MDRAMPRIQEPQRAPEHEPRTHELLTEIRDLLMKTVGQGGGARLWAQEYIDLPASGVGGAQLIRKHPGRKSLSIYNAGPGNAYFGKLPHVTALTGMPILATAEREFQHEAGMYFIADAAGCRLIYSEEWEP